MARGQAHTTGEMPGGGGAVCETWARPRAAVSGAELTRHGGSVGRVQMREQRGATALHLGHAGRAGLVARPRTMVSYASGMRGWPCGKHKPKMARSSELVGDAAARMRSFSRMCRLRSSARSRFAA